MKSCRQWWGKSWALVVGYEHGLVHNLQHPWRDVVRLPTPLPTQLFGHRRKLSIYCCFHQLIDIKPFFVHRRLFDRKRVIIRALMRIASLIYMNVDLKTPSGYAPPLHSFSWVEVSLRRFLSRIAYSTLSALIIELIFFYSLLFDFPFFVVL